MTERSDVAESGLEEADDPTPAGPADPTPSGPDDPSPETPEQSVPTQEVPSPTENYGNVDSALQAWFWKVVLLLKLSIIGATLGSLLAWFEADYRRGGMLLAGSIVLFGYTVREARKLKAHADAGEFDHDLPEESGETTDQ